MREYSWKWWLVGIGGGIAIIATVMIVAFVIQQTLAGIF